MKDEVMSFEEFISDLYWSEHRLKAYKANDMEFLRQKPEKIDRDISRKELEKLSVFFAAINVDMSLFKNTETGQYQITSSIADFFWSILRVYDTDDYRHIRKLEFEAVPQQTLIMFRLNLFSTLQDAGMELNAIHKIISRFDRRTGCPSFLEGFPIDSFMETASADIARSLSVRDLGVLDRYCVKDCELTNPMDESDWFLLRLFLYKDYKSMANQLINKWSTIANKFQKSREASDQKTRQAILADPAATRHAKRLYQLECYIKASEALKELELKISEVHARHQRKKINELNSLEREREVLLLNLHKMYIQSSDWSQDDEQIYKDILDAHCINEYTLIEQILEQ